MADETPTPTYSRPWMERFIGLYASTGNMSLSAHGCGIARDTAYDARRRDPVFADALANAREVAVDSLEAEARNRALKGSDVLLIFLLKAARPDIYRDNARVELTGAGGGPVRTANLTLTASLTDRERTFIRDALRSQAAADDTTEEPG